MLHLSNNFVDDIEQGDSINQDVENMDINNVNIENKLRGLMLRNNLLILLNNLEHLGIHDNY